MSLHFLSVGEVLWFTSKMSPEGLPGGAGAWSEGKGSLSVTWRGVFLSLARPLCFQASFTE